MEAPKPDSTPVPVAAAKNERAALMAGFGALGLVVFMIFFVFLMPTGPLKKFRNTRNDLDDARKQFSLVKNAKDTEETRLRSQDEVMALLKERKPNFDLWSFMNTVLTETKLKERANLENFKPQSKKGTAIEDISMVQLKLSAVTLTEIVDLLHKIYDSKNLVVLYRLEYLRPSADNKGLECNVTLLSPKVV